MDKGYNPGVVMISCEYPPFPGGIGSYSSGIVGALREMGIRVQVIAPDYPDMAVPDVELDTHRVLGHHRIGPKSLWRMQKLLRQMPSDDYLLAADIRSVLALWITGFWHRRSWRVMVHGSEASKFHPGHPLFALVRSAYLRAELVAYNSSATRDLFHSRIGLPARETVCGLGVDLRWFSPPPQIKEISTSYFESPTLAELLPDSPLVVSVGRIEARKGQLETVQAIARLPFHGVDHAVYVVCGRVENSEYAREVQAEAERLGVKLVMTGAISEADLKRLFRRAICHSLFARQLPGKIEGFGLVLIEAGAQHCPSVSTRVGGIPEVIDDAGQLLDPGDIDGFAGAIASYLHNPAKRAADGVAAYKRARSFSWAACAARTFPELGIAPI